MNRDNSLIGFSLSSNIGDKNGDYFREYLWSSKSVLNNFELPPKKYGNDFKLILFRFYINPIKYLENNLKPIEKYSKSEKSIGIPVIINKRNFFDLSEKGKQKFLSSIIFEKIDLLRKIVIKEKLDLNIDLLRSDIFDCFK